MSESKKAEIWRVVGELVYGMLLVSTGAVFAWSLRDQKAKADASDKAVWNDNIDLTRRLEAQAAEVAALRAEVRASLNREAMLKGALAELRGELLAECEAEDAAKAAAASQQENGVRVDEPERATNGEARHG